MSKQIGQLPQLTAPAGGDRLAIEDVSAAATKYIELDDLPFDAAGAAGAVAADVVTAQSTADGAQQAIDDHEADTADAHDASAISVDASGFSGILSGSDTDVQQALDTIDAAAATDPKSYATRIFARRAF